MFLVLCWLLVAIAYEAEGRVDNNFTNCIEPFFEGQIPVGFEGIASPHDFKEIPDAITDINDLASPAYICQTHEGRSYYATLYDRGRRIPLYSAYILDRKSNKPLEDCKRTRTFTLEPQLIYRGLTENMQLTKDTKEAIKDENRKKNISEIFPKNRITNLMETSQAVESDYANSGYTRGHINPCGHHTEKVNFQSTFTLTNMVPMAAQLNNKVWSDYEQEMVNISAGCTTMYVVTGSVPGNNAMKGRVTIPSYVWNAYCCVDNNGKPIKSGGAIAANDMALTSNNTFVVDKMELSGLQLNLKKHLRVSKNIQLFHCNCKVPTCIGCCPII